MLIAQQSRQHVRVEVLLLLLPIPNPIFADTETDLLGSSYQDGSMHVFDIEKKFLQWIGNS